MTRLNVMFVASIFVMSHLAYAGQACETNAKSLERNLNRKCAAKKGADCKKCVEDTFKTLTRALGKSCQDEVNVVKENFEQAHCQ